ncbi:hypothetical protein JYT22_00465 [Endomicrobium sp. AH-315-J14]|nr:hypothetical protein [Endomicrobium sp. AH-315-J14]
MAHPLRSDPFVAAEIEVAIAPYLGKVPEEELEFMRDELARLLEDDPEARLALDGAYPREVDESGTQEKRGAKVTPGKSDREVG